MRHNGIVRKLLCSVYLGCPSSVHLAFFPFFFLGSIIMDYGWYNLVSPLKFLSFFPCSVCNVVKYSGCKLDWVLYYYNSN